MCYKLVFCCDPPDNNYKQRYRYEHNDYFDMEVNFDENEWKCLEKMRLIFYGLQNFIYLIRETEKLAGVTHFFSEAK